MKKLLYSFAKFCPKTGKFRGFKRLSGFSILLFPLVGLLSLGWIIFRVATKPSRINYPCVRAAMPFASSFVGELLVLTASAFAFLRSKRKRFVAQPYFAGAFFIMGVAGSLWISGVVARDSDVRYPDIVLDANKPVGTARGIFPGRVVWVHDSTATNQQCVPNAIGHGWFLPENNNQPVIDAMVSSAIRELTGTSSDANAWDSIFVYHNRNCGRGAVGYTSGEKIFIKTNATSSWDGNFSTTDLSVANNSYYGVSETSPAIVLSVLRQLVNTVGVPQTAIYVGDPLKHIYKHCYTLWHSEFPSVHYLDHDGYSNLGRELAVKSTTGKVYYSDHDTVLTVNGVPVHSDYVYRIFQDATYVLDIPMLKGHLRAGVTMFAKNHFGSQTRDDASQLHNGLVAPDGVNATRTGYGLYRVQVDLMGSSILSGKNLFYLMDALWATDYELDTPVKWKLSPFNNTFMSSVFASFDPVAIECVGYDFLRSEFTDARSKSDGTSTHVQMPGVDDYLRQAADTTAWPAGIKYDPDSSGTHISSLGVYEHWNDSLDREYSRNLGTGNGIELVKVETVTGVDHHENGIPEEFVLYQNYPNPFNPTTTIRFSLYRTARVRLAIYDVTGRIVERLVNGETKYPGTYSVVFSAARLSSGTYLARIDADGITRTEKLVLLK